MKKIYMCLALVVMFMINFCYRIQEVEPLKIGATYMNMNNPYFVTLNNSIQQVVNTNGDILIARDPSQDQERQNQIVKDMILEGIDILILQPVNWKEVEPALDACKEAGIPVIVADSEVFDNEDIVFSVLSDNYKAGQLIGKDLMKKKPDARIVLVYDDKINSNNQRIEGVKDTLGNNTKYQIVEEFHTTEGLEPSMNAIEECIEQEIEFDVIVGNNDPTALGALAAVQKEGLEKELLIYGVDGSPDAKMMITKGYMEGTSAQNPNDIGKIVAENLYKYLAGEEIEKEIIVDVEFIDKGNVSDFNIAGW